MKVYVISLKEASERRRSISDALNVLGIDFEFFDAVRGSDLSENEIKDLCDTEQIEQNKKWMSPGAIGCALSHVQLYQKIIKEGSDHAVILEDDMILGEGFGEIIRALDQRTLKGELILLYYRSLKEVLLSAKSKSPLTPNHALFNLANYDVYPNTTGGYYITADLCQKLIDFIYPIRMASDSWAVFHEKSVIEDIKLVYPRPLSDAGFKSDIDYVDSYYHPLIGRVMQLLNTYKIPPFYQLLKLRRRHIERRMSSFTILDD